MSTLGFVWLQYTSVAAVLCGEFSSAVRADGVLSSRLSAWLPGQQTSGLPGHDGRGREACSCRLVQEAEACLVPISGSRRWRWRRGGLSNCSYDQRSRQLRVSDRTRHELPSITEGTHCLGNVRKTNYFCVIGLGLRQRFLKWPPWGLPSSSPKAEAWTSICIQKSMVKALAPFYFCRI